MKLDHFLATFIATAALGCLSLRAQGPPQPQITFTPGSSGTWNADWDGVTNRTYFVQFSLDLVKWNFAPTLRHGNGVQSLGIQTEDADKFFIRLNYVDDSSVTTLAQAEAADFDGDGLTNLQEIQSLGSNPLSLDSDGDQMPDAWEYQHGFNLALNDADGDPDNDGLTNLQEYLASTDPRYYDTDRDGFSDAFEVQTAGYDPLVFNEPSGDADLDGLSDMDEITYGTSSATADSDQDGFTDFQEVTSGSNPLDSQRTPFSPSAHFKDPISNTDVLPMGNLGVANYGNGDSYKVSFQIYDTNSSSIISDVGLIWSTNQESWRINIGDSMGVTTIPYRRLAPGGGEYRAYTNVNQLQLDSKKTYIAKLQHLGLAGIDYSGIYNTPDYRHSLTMLSQDFLFVTNDTNIPVRNYIYASKSAPSYLGDPGLFPDGYDWSTRINYLVPIVRLGYSTSYTGSDATGPRFRKISHTGRPLPDVKPEAESESDEALEESYVDAFDLSVHHDTSFASIPLSSSDLRLEANASVRETTWSSRSGLRPEEEITSPFGIAWSSNLCAYIETVETLGSSTTRPTTVSVVDESGRPQRFGTSDNMETFFPWPSSLTDKKTYLNELAKVGDDLVLTKKYGNKLTYRPCEAWFMYSSDRLESTPTVVRHRYWRLEEVEDRFGAKVIYNYGNNPYSLIPVEISAAGRAGQKLTIARSANGRRVESITDAEGEVTEFHYTDRTATVPSTTLQYPYQELSRVTFPGGAEEHYIYEVATDAETVGTKVTQHLHANLKSIQRDGQAKRVFTYAFDRTKKWYDHSLGRVAISASMTSLPTDISSKATAYVNTINKVPQAGAVLRAQYGLPRTVSMIEWPSMNIQATFAKTATTQTTFGPVFSSVNSTEVTDAEGKKYTYAFGGTHGEIIDTDSSYVGGTSSVSAQWLVYHSTTTLHYKTPGGAVLGSETFEFDPNSGLSLKRTVDFSGNETNWLFEQTRPAGPRITLENNANFLSKWADPTKKTDALNRIENYEYGNYRMLTKLTDIHGTITDYTVDALGRRTVMTVKDAGDNLIQKETYDYENATFPGFMTRKTRKVFSNLSGKSWEVDLVVEYVPDAYGRVWKEFVDPSGENLQTIHTYDLNNQKLTTTDARNLPTTFLHDGRNRLEKVTYADNTFKTFGYDDNNAKIRETDENGNSTLIERDGLGRVKKSARDMNGDGLIGTGDLITQFGYDDVGLLRKNVDPRGFATVTFYDDLHRPQHVFTGVPEASADGSLATLTSLASSSQTVTHQELSYDVAQNTGGGLLNPFKPTGITRHNVVSMDPAQADATLEDTTVYDDVYRPTETNSEYAPGFAKTTLFDYGTVNGNGHEPLVSTVTDSLGKVTQSTRDALGRETEIIDGFGNTDPDLVLTATTHYTSTGLLWRVIDPLSRHSETEYNSVGRPVKGFQPDPVTGLITANSPVTESVFDQNGNVAAVIDANLNRTDSDYDNRNRNWRTRQPAVTDATNPDFPASNVRPTTTVYFDNVGNEIAVTDPRGSTIRKFYDKANRVFKTRTNPVSGNPSDVVATPGTHDITTTTEYDNGGLALSVEDGNGNITRNAYDNLGRLTATACDPSDGDPAAVPASGLDPAAYRSSNASCALVSYIHDDSGNVIEVTDGKSHQTAFTFDGFNRKTSSIWDPGKTLKRTETSEFNALVQTFRVDGKIHRTKYEYDGLHRLTDVVYRPNTSGTSHIDNRHLTYDKAGKVLTVTYPNEPGSIRNVTSSFDKLDRLISETSAGVTHTYPEYDKAGNRKQTTYGRTGTTLVSTYDSLNRLETCEERSYAATPSGRTTIYAYDLGGLVTRKTLPNGNATTTTRDKLGRTLLMVEKTSALAMVSSFDYSQAVGSWPYSHDAVGNVLRCAENHTLAGMTDRVVANTYDHCNRLDSETITPSGGTAITTDYDYDLADNQTFKTIGSSITEYKFGNGSNGSNSNQLREYGPAGQTATHTFTHDNNGNRETRVTAVGTENYTWDDENRLTALGTPGGDYAYSYDHRSRRVVRDESAASGSLTELTFVGGSSVQEANSSGTVQVELIRGSDWGGGVGGVLFTIRSGDRSYNAYNSRGDVVSTSDGTGTATWQASYEAFGTRTEEGGSNTERQRANTKDEDPTGLLNEGFRYRDLEAGVFISRDPLGFVDGPNVYAYVRQNPWSKFDPLGLYEVEGGGVSNSWLDKSKAIQSNPNRTFGDSMKAMAYGIGGAVGIVPEAVSYSFRGAEKGLAQAQVQINADQAAGKMNSAVAGMARVGVEVFGEGSLMITGMGLLRPVHEAINEPTPGNVFEASMALIVVKGPAGDSGLPSSARSVAAKGGDSHVYGVIDTQTGTLAKPGMSSGPIPDRMNQSVSQANQRSGVPGQHKGVILERGMTPAQARAHEQKLTDKVEVRRPGTFPNRFHQRPTPKVETKNQFKEKYGHEHNK